MSAFDRHPCFKGGDIGITAMGVACHRLSDVLAAFPEAAEARRALGDPFMPSRNSEALRILRELPARMQQKILDADAGKRPAASTRTRRP
ncbi:hypothetical protein ACQKQD_18845 [Methylobacterium sp. NPDC080182]|uniref:hypothetical protein n=1 Tax=Methylobacterium sp. NPDC080182 TaxID=3390590 RepID=UPI003D00BF46